MLLKCHRAVLTYSATYCSGKGGSNFHRDVEQFSVTITLEVDEKYVAAMMPVDCSLQGSLEF